MQFSEFRHKNLHVVFLFDPITVDTISIDSLKSSSAFKIISFISEATIGGVLALASDKLKVTIQSNRLEYKDESEAPFTNRKLDELWKLLRLLPRFSVKAYGITFFSRLIPASEETAGRYIATGYIKDNANLEKTLETPDQPPVV